jgi:hypothetical protein
MPEPQKDQVAEAVVTALQGVTIGAGFRTDLGNNVSRRRVLMNEVNTLLLPATSVWIGDSQRAPVQCTGAYRERADLLVETFYRSEAKEDLDRDGIRIEADVRSAVLDADTFSSVTSVKLVNPGAVAADHQEFADDRIGRRLVAFEVDYTWTADSP